MPPLQPFVSNIPLQLAKNLRFDDDNKIPVTQLLPVGMNGTIPNDNPKTGYISRIGAVLSDQIDLYNQVSSTLQSYGQSISDLQQSVIGLETSGTTIPIINGKCFTGNANSPITTVVTLMADSACSYNTVLGTPTALTQAIIAQGASALNILSAFSQNSAMAGLPGWVSAPTTIADSFTDLWLSYLDSRAGVTKALAAISPTCSQIIIDYSAIYRTAAGSGSGFFVYFSGYSFIPTGYTDNGSTITITDGSGGTYTAGINIVNWSNAGTDALFVGISGTNLLTTANSYQVTVKSSIINGSNSCSKVVIHNVANSNSASSATTSTYPRTVISNDLLAQTTGVTSVVSYTPSGTSTFQMAGYVSVVSISGYTLTGTLSYVDENGSQQSISIISDNVTGPLSLNRIFRARGGSTITVSTGLSSQGSINYDIGIALIQLS